MNPDVAEAIPKLVSAGVLTPEQAALTLRAARGELVSLRVELRALLYAGVLVAVAGVGLLVKENLDRIGPVAIAVGIGLAAAACFAWVLHTALPFSWGEQASPHLAFDYILLLGALLTAADLAFIEVKFTPLGADWPWHLLVVSLLYGLLAFRFDSRVVLSLALSTFAAWRGVAPSTFATWSWVRSDALTIRLNAVACGVLFVVLGAVIARRGWKAHFEPVAAHLGWLLVLGGLASGVLQPDLPGHGWPIYTAVLLATSVGLGALAARAGRFPLFGLAVVAAYLALARAFVAAVHSEKVTALFFTVSAVGVVAALYLARGWIRESE